MLGPELYTALKKLAGCVALVFCCMLAPIMVLQLIPILQNTGE